MIWTTKQVEELKDLLSQSKKPKEISEIMGIPAQNISSKITHLKRLREYPASPKTKAPAAESIAEVSKKADAAGMTYGEYVRQLNSEIVSTPQSAKIPMPDIAIVAINDKINGLKRTADSVSAEIEKLVECRDNAKKQADELITWLREQEV